MKNTTGLTLENEKLKIEIGRLMLENQELRKLNDWYYEHFKLAQHPRQQHLPPKSYQFQEIRIHRGPEH